MIEITMLSAIALTILAVSSKVYGAYDRPKESALILCAGVGAAWAIWSNLDLRPLICQLAVAYLLYACASITWTRNKRIAAASLYQRAAFIFFFLVAYNAETSLKTFTLWVIATSAGLCSFWAFYKWFIKSRWDNKPFVKHRKAYGTIGNISKAACVYLPAFFISLHLICNAPGTPERVLAVALAALCLSGIIHARSRSTLIGLCAGCGYLIIC